jgi:dethiobiotin synthetase
MGTQLETRGRGVRAPKIIFITGTDTGVGKTLLTSLLLCHLRQTGHHALALKPFCSGIRADARLLHTLQEGELPLDEINPFFFPEPVAPFAAVHNREGSIKLEEVLDHIRSIAFRAPSTPDARHKSLKAKKSTVKTLLIEGSGGLLVPLGKGYSILDLITALHCETIVVSPNRLGTINHTLLTVQALETAAGSPCRSALHAPKIVLMAPRVPDPSSASNPRILAEMLSPLPLFLLPFLGAHCRTAAVIRASAARLRPILARLV